MKALGTSARKKISLLGGFKVLAVLAIAVGFGFAAERTDAAHSAHGIAAKPAKEAVTSVVAKDIVAKDVETTSSIEAKSANDAPCNISRKRLFVEGEGWIVRRVSICY